MRQSLASSSRCLAALRRCSSTCSWRWNSALGLAVISLRNCRSVAHTTAANLREERFDFAGFADIALDGQRLVTDRFDDRLRLVRRLRVSERDGESVLG